LDGHLSAAQKGSEFYSNRAARSLKMTSGSNVGLHSEALLKCIIKGVSTDMMHAKPVHEADFTVIS